MSFLFCLPAIRHVDEGEQIILSGCGPKRVIQGPKTFCVGCCISKQHQQGITLSETEYVKTVDSLTGAIQVVRGPRLYFLDTKERMVDHGKKNAIQLGPTAYLIVSHEKTGQVRQIIGPTLFVPGPYDRVEETLEAIPLKHFEYIRIMNKQTGKVRVEKGQNLIYLDPMEKILDAGSNQGVKSAINIDEHTAVLVRNTHTGQLRLETTQQLYIPAAHEEVEEVRKKILLEDHETIIIKDKDGCFHFKHGGKPMPQKQPRKKVSPQTAKSQKEKLIQFQEFQDSDELTHQMLEDEYERAFFLPPYCELVKLQWSSTSGGITKSRKNQVWKIDRRPRYLNYQFMCRTCDNVELILELTFFWQVTDVKTMIEFTQDPKGDICQHARSIVIERVSRVTLEKFMQEFNQLIKQYVLETDDSFYRDRGCIVHSVEVLSYHCKDQETERTLQAIIKETTDRLNRLQQVQSENEVKLYTMKGDIEQEKLHGELLKIRHSHHVAEATMEGEAEADQIKNYLDGLEGIDMETKLQMWNTLRKLDSLSTLSKGNSNMYFTPSDVNLSIETFGNPRKNEASNDTVRSRHAPSHGTSGSTTAFEGRKDK
eukprot:CAMPEP_0168537786 /NCGR_PEP_ID=MMETSP0405-20121227/20620_1 /TAXON_ID=498012 /ORGANISM="Trichosphaerium sp, Strain Am-I-7 wt" /LENGTH=595 /DNA_ID=CAMNT_0008566585 /DNA_START=52 /DNA_END=1839 /DNA_ORIENTATION=-